MNKAPGGVEPSTFCLLGRRSNQLSYRADVMEPSNKRLYYYSKFVIIIDTNDLIHLRVLIISDGMTTFNDAMDLRSYLKINITVLLEIYVDQGN